MTLSTHPSSSLHLEKFTSTYFAVLNHAHPEYRSKESWWVSPQAHHLYRLCIFPSCPYIDHLAPFSSSFTFSSSLFHLLLLRLLPLLLISPTASPRFAVCASDTSGWILSPYAASPGKRAKEFRQSVQHAHSLRDTTRPYRYSEAGATRSAVLVQQSRSALPDQIAHCFPTSARHPTEKLKKNPIGPLVIIAKGTCFKPPCSSSLLFPSLASLFCSNLCRSRCQHSP